MVHNCLKSIEYQLIPHLLYPDLPERGHWRAQLRGRVTRHQPGVQDLVRILRGEEAVRQC